MKKTDPLTLNWQPLSKRKLTAWSKLTTRKGREQSGQIIVEGVRLVAEALSANLPIEAVVACGPNGIAAAKRACLLAGAANLDCFDADQASFARLCDTVHSAGVIAVVAWAPSDETQLNEFKPRRVLYCDAIADPGNLGTLIRTAAGLGLDLVVIGEESVEVTNPKVIRSTAGAVFRIPIVTGCTVADFLRFSRKLKLHIVLADPSGGDIPVFPESRGWVAVVGGETTGLDPAWPSDGVTRFRITMHHGVESLNASVAGALLMDRLCNIDGNRPAANP